MGLIAVAVGLVGAYEAYSASQYVADPNVSGQIYEFTECYSYNNTCSSDSMMIPTNTSGEWSSVKARAPGCLNLAVSSSCTDGSSTTDGSATSGSGDGGGGGY